MYIKKVSITLFMILFISNVFGQENEAVKIERNDNQKYLNATIIDKLKLKNYLVKTVEVPGIIPEMEKEQKLIFENLTTKEIYTSDYSSERIVKYFPEIDNILFVSVLPCSNCDASNESKMYIISEYEIFIIPFEFNTSKFGCPCYNDSTFQAPAIFIKREIRFDKTNKKLYCFDREPDCSNYENDDFTGLIRCSEEKILKPKSIIETFTIIDLNTKNGGIISYKNEGIPSNYLKLWKSSKKIKIQ